MHSFASLGLSFHRMRLYPLASLGIVSVSLGRGIQLSLWDSTTAASILARVYLLINCVQPGMFHPVRARNVLGNKPVQRRSESLDGLQEHS